MVYDPGFLSEVKERKMLGADPKIVLHPPPLVLDLRSGASRMKREIEAT